MKQQKKLTMIILFLAAVLCAQSTDDSLKLGEIEIIGESEVFVDSLQESSENLEYIRKTELASFDYKPQVTEHKVFPQSFITSSRQVKLRLLGGSNSRMEGNLLVNPPHMTLWRFNADYYSENFQDGHARTDYSLYWLPSWQKYRAVISYQDFHADTKNHYEEGESSFTSFRFNLPELSYGHNDYGRIELNSQFAYNEYIQSDLVYEYSGKELAGNINLDWLRSPLQAKIFINWQEKGSQLGSEISLAQRFLDKMTLWFAWDDEFYATFKYSQSFLLGNNFALILKNDPYITSRDYKAILEENHNLRVDSSQKQTSALINHFLSLHYEGSFFVSLTCNTRYLKDKMTIDYYYWDWDCAILYYDPSFIDLWEHEFSAKMSWKKKNLTFTNQVSYTGYSQKVLYVPKFELYSSTEYQHKNFITRLILDYTDYNMNSAVCDTYIHINNIKDIDDKFMIDLIFVYQLIDNLNLSVKIENIANDIYQEHDLAPGRSRTVLGGFEVKF